MVAKPAKVANKRFKTGDRVVHPRFGFGVIQGSTAHEQNGTTTKYYSIHLMDGSVLSVPQARAEELGLRRTVNTLADTVACLRSRARPLPDNTRLRVAELHARWQEAQPTALVHAVRDLLGYARKRRLTTSDKKWLSSACERLSVEASLVDKIELAEARAAIRHEVDRLSVRRTPST